MSVKDNKAAVRRYVEEIVNEGRIELVDSIFSAELALHLPHLPRPLNGRDMFVQLIGQTRTVFPDMHMEIDDMLAEGDKVFTRGAFRGTYHGEPLGQSPGSRIADGIRPIVLVAGMTLFRFEAKRIIEIWVEENFTEALRQLGIPPAFPPELACIKGWSN